MTMGTEMITMERKKRGGRIPGSKNRSTLIGKDVAETLKNWLGFDSAAVERGQLNAAGYRGRLKLKAMWDDERPVDPQFVVLAKFLFSYAFGNPGKMVMDSGQKQASVLFVSSRDYKPYDARANPEIDERSRQMNLENDKQLALEAAEKAKPVVLEPEPEGETLELLPPPPGESR